MAFFRGISGRLLILTILVVMVVEVAIFVPSVALFRKAYLDERIARAQIASLALLASPDDTISQDLKRELLDNAEAVNIVLQRDGVRQFVISNQTGLTASKYIDLRDATALKLVLDALNRMAVPTDGDLIHVRGIPPKGGGQLIEIKLDPGPLRKEMWDYGWRIFRLSLIISLITAGGVFLLIRRIVVRPILDVTGNIMAFREDPQDPETTIRPRRSTGEIADAEYALAAMQEDMRRALKERARLASLGEAVAKISHDLRNLLSTQQLLVDRLEHSKDPSVGRVMPKMIGALNRAISLCQRTLDFGRAEEQPPDIRNVALRELVEEVAEGLGQTDGAPVQAEIDIDPGQTVQADPDQFHRILTNLMRNAGQAIQATGKTGRIRISVRQNDTCEVVHLRDTGPGLPKKALENLFQPFKGGASKGGAGLGLAIAHDLVRAHGGKLELVSTTTEGTEFAIHLLRSPS